MPLGEAGGKVDEALISASVSAQPTLRLPPEEEKPGTSHVLEVRGRQENGVVPAQEYVV